MGSLTPSAVEKVLKHLVGKESFTVTAYLGLFTTAPSESSAGVEVPTTVSTVGTGYARKDMPPSVWTYNAATKAISNNADIVFNNAAVAWGTVVAVGLFGSPTGSDLLWYSPMATSVEVKQSNTLAINSNSIFLEFIGEAIFTDSFDLDTSSNYGLEFETSLLSVEKAYDPVAGYKDEGSLRVSVTRNTATSGTTTTVLRTGLIQAAGSKGYTIIAAARTTNTKILPKLFVQFLDFSEGVTEVVSETVSTEGSNPLLFDRWQARTISFTTDSSTRFLRVGLYLEATEGGQTGTVWLDNIRVVPSS